MTAIISFDIDGVIGNNFYEYSDLTSYYASHGSIIIAAGIKHGIPPGMLELSQRLHAENTIAKVICFSSAAFARNGEFWATFLKQSLSRTQFREVIKRAQVFSNDDLSNVCEKDAADGYRKFKTAGGEQKKKLRLLVGEKELENTLHIDDDCSFVFPGEDANVLIPLATCVNDFKKPPKESSEHIWYIANQACYIAGVIFSCIEYANKQSISVSHALFQMQYEACVEERFQPKHKALQKENSLYLKGLEELQKVNPHFTFAEAITSSMPDRWETLLKKMNAFQRLFKDHWGSKEFSKACEVVDEMLDSIVRESGAWEESSKIVCEAVVPLMKEVCETPLSIEAALLLLPRIIDIPLEKERSFCVKTYLAALPQEIRSEVLMNLAIIYWDEMQYHTAFNMLEDLLLSCKTDQSFAFMEAAFKEICRSVVREGNEIRLLELAKRIIHLSSQIACLNDLLQATGKSYPKMKVLCSLATAYFSQDREGDALQSLEDAVNVMNKSGIDYGDAEFLWVVDSFKRTAGVLTTTAIPVFKKLENKTLNNILLAHSCSFIEGRERFSCFYQLAKDAVHLDEKVHFYILMLGLSMLENSLKIRQELGPQAVKLLMYLLGGYYNLKKKRYCSHLYGMELPSDCEMSFPHIKTFLCSLETSYKKAEALANLSKIYWKTNQTELSLQLIPEMGTSDVIDPLHFTLAFFQRKERINLKHKIKDEELIDQSRSGIAKEMAITIFQSENQGTNKKMCAAVVAVDLWNRSQYSEALKKAGEIKNGYSDKEIITSQLIFFVISEFCRSSTTSGNEKEIRNLISEIAHPFLKIEALKAAIANSTEYSEVKGALTSELITSYWKLKRTKKALKLLEGWITSQKKTSFWRESYEIADGFKAIFKQGIPPEHAPKLLSLLDGFTEKDEPFYAIEEFIKALDETHTATLELIFERTKEKSASRGTRFIYYCLAEKYWSLKRYDTSFEAMENFLQGNSESDLFNPHSKSIHYMIQSICREGVPETYQEQMSSFILKLGDKQRIQALKYFIPVYTFASLEVLGHIEIAIIESKDNDDRSESMKELSLLYLRSNQSQKALKMIDQFRQGKYGDRYLKDLLYTLSQTSLKIEGHGELFNYVKEIKDEDYKKRALESLLNYLPKDLHEIRSEVQALLRSFQQTRVAYNGSFYGGYYF